MAKKKTATKPKGKKFPVTEDEAPNKPVKKGEGKMKGDKPAKASTKTKTKDTSGPLDALSLTVRRVENMGKAEARENSVRLAENVHLNYFELGGVLSRIQSEKWWEGDAETFNDFVAETYDFKFRKAYYLIEAYNALVDSEVTEEQVSGIGWIKLSIIAKILTKDNAAQWLKKATNLSVLALRDAVADEANKGTGEKGKEPPKEKGKTLSFKLHPDQLETVETALDKAKAEAETEYPAVALEGICLSYLSAGKAPKAPKLKDVLKKAGAEKVLETFGEVFPDVEITVEMPDESEED